MYFQNQRTVKLGIISVAGKPSSTNVNIAAITPTLPFNIQKCRNAAKGAQIKSTDSPRTGIKYDELPIKSNTIALTRAIFRSDLFISLLFITLISILLISCKSAKNKEITVEDNKNPIQATSTFNTNITKPIVTTLENPPIKLIAKFVDDESLIELRDLSDDFEYDIKYASPSNSFNTQLYPCARCLLRFEVAKALLKANEAFKSKGLHIKLFDCFRPISVQKKMWAIVPNASYVKNPYDSPSMHNRGIAIDLTLVDTHGKEIDMGTTYDYFGHKAHQDYTDLPKNVLENRRLLRETLIKYGFRPIRTEWWHYSFHTHYPVADSIFNCH